MCHEVAHLIIFGVVNSNTISEEKTALNSHIAPTQ